MTSTPAINLPGSALPSIFVAHGAPDLPLGNNPARQFLSTLASRIKRPRAIIVISAHWQERVATISRAPAPRTIHDFAGWPGPLYDMTYPARTDPDLVAEIIDLLKRAGIRHGTDDGRGYDHGVWVPLSLIYPGADIPVVQISLSLNGSPGFHLDLGRALAPLRLREILIIGSGASVHNLGALAPEGSAPPDWALAFEDWLHDAISTSDLEELLKFPRRPAEARIAHPTPEHLMPLFVNIGAGLGTETGKAGYGFERLYHGFSYGSIGMTSYAFGSRS